MKLVSPDGSDLLAVQKVTRSGDDILVEGTIMGAMPLKAILTPDQLREGIKFAKRDVISAALKAIVRRKPRAR